MARSSAVIEELDMPKEPEKPEESTEELESSTPKVSSVGFFEQISRFSNVEWEQHIIYVYRLAPITDRTAGGTTKYVQKYASRFDQETLKADLGSGRYRLQLNRYGDKGQSKTVRTFEIDIEDMNFPPKVPPGEWLDDPRNKRWAWARKKEEQNGAAAGADSWTPERVMKFVKELRPDVPQNDQMSITKAVLDAVKETRAELGKANDPAAMITTLKELILIAKPAETKPEGENQQFTLLMRMLDASEKRAEQAIADAREERKRADADRQRAHEIQLAESKRAHELELERIKQKDAAVDPLEMVEKVLTLQEKLGGGERTRRPGWPGLLEDHADRLLDLGEKALGAIAYKRSQPAPSVQQRPAQQQQQPAQNPPAQSAPVSTTTQETPMPQPPQDPDIAMLLPILEQQGMRLVQAFKADPLSGCEVAAAIASPLLAGKAGYERIARMGRDKILATIELIPQMKADLLAIGTQEMINDFIDDIIAGPEDPDEDDDGDDEDNGDPEPGFADPANPDDRKPNRSVGPKIQRKKVPA